VTIFENSENFTERVIALEPKPDIVFLDIHVKPYSGFEMLKVLRQFEWGNKIPIVALTASVMNEEIYELRTAGFNGCLAKPIHLASFPGTIERILLGEAIWRIIS
jgi:CheY-like chemotaxis protein